MSFYTGSLTVSYGRGWVRAVVLYWYECLLVVLACRAYMNALCVPGAVNRRGFVWKFFFFLCATDKFYSIRSFASVQGEPQR